jgi:hypothetical protein
LEQPDEKGGGFVVWTGIKTWAKLRSRPAALARARRGS